MILTDDQKFRLASLLNISFVTFDDRVRALDLFFMPDIDRTAFYISLLQSAEVANEIALSNVDSSVDATRNSLLSDSQLLQSIVDALNAPPDPPGPPTPPIVVTP